MPAKLNLRTAKEIATRIARRNRSTCSHTTVWRAARKLKIKPAFVTPGGYQLYSAEQTRLIERRLVQTFASVGRTLKTTQPAR